MAKSNHLMALMSLWGVILVVLGHSGFEEPFIAEKLRWLDTWIYMFHMPLFFFISGYLYSFTNKNFDEIDVKKFLKKKFIRLYVPYIVLGLIVFCIKFCMSGFMGISRSYSLQDFLMMFIAPRWPNSTMGYLWFIGTMFFMFIVIAILGKLRINLRTLSVSIIIVAILWLLNNSLEGQDLWYKVFNLEALLWYIPFFIMGIHYQMNETILSSYAKGGVTKLILFFLLTILGAWLLMQNYTIKYLFRITFAVIGIWFSMVLCNTLLQNDFFYRKILPYGDITYTIYLMSFFGQYSAKALIVNILHLHWYHCVICMFIGGLVFPLIVYQIYLATNKFDENKFLKVLIGV